MTRHGDDGPVQRRWRVLVLTVAMAVAVAAHDVCAQVPPVPPPAPQNPSPMVEHSRAHGRIPQQDVPGMRRTFVGPLGKSVQVFVPSGGGRSGSLRLVIHFHGAAFIPEAAVSRLGKDYVAATVNLAPGSGVYDRTFGDPAVYDSLVAGIVREASAAVGRPVTVAQRLLITHSEIFPGTFASTTETTDYLVQTLGLARTAVLRWGPGGMQQLSEVRRGRFEIMGFAGNTAPDHIDQFHGMPEFLRRVERQ